ncbi:MAG: hypothetical protein HY459_04050 [Parcubacteria group bacterium]|nr:hypothetical protein [Parcubacteria group bacterium]
MNIHVLARDASSWMNSRPAYWKRVALWAALLAVSLVVGFLVCIQCDGGFYLDEADKILHGEVALRDFRNPPIPPLTSYILAGWFKLFGVNTTTLSLGIAALFFAISLVVAHITKQLTANLLFASVHALYFLIGIAPLWPSFSHHWFNLFFLLLAASALISAFSRQGGVIGF